MGLFDFLKRKELSEIASLKERIESLSKYQDIVDTDALIERKMQEFQKQSDEIQEHIDELKTKYQQGYNTFLNLQKQTEIYSDTLEMAEFGMYEPHFDFDTSDEYKEKILSIREKQKDLIKSKEAVLGGDDISWNGSISKGRSMVAREKN